jgi:DNA-binding NarL/FixJ family response regulator
LDRRVHSHKGGASGDSRRFEEAVIEQIRIVLADLPALAADLVERVVDTQADMAVVARLDGAPDLPDLARAGEPDVVMIGLADSPALPEACLPMFAANGALTVLGLQHDGAVAHLYRLRLEHHELGEFSPQELVTLIRRAARRSPSTEPWPATPRSLP